MKFKSYSNWMQSRERSGKLNDSQVYNGPAECNTKLKLNGGASFIQKSNNNNRVKWTTHLEPIRMRSIKYPICFFWTLTIEMKGKHFFFPFWNKRENTFDGRHLNSVSLRLRFGPTKTGAALNLMHIWIRMKKDHKNVVVSVTRRLGNLGESQHFLCRQWRTAFAAAHIAHLVHAHTQFTDPKLES